MTIVVTGSVIGLIIFSPQYSGEIINNNYIQYKTSLAQCIRDDSKTARSPMGGGGVIKNPRIGHKKTQGKRGGGHKFLTARFMNKMYPFSQDYDYNHGLAVTSILSLSASTSTVDS